MIKYDFDHYTQFISVLEFEFSQQAMRHCIKECEQIVEGKSLFSDEFLPLVLALYSEASVDFSLTDPSI